MLPGSPSRTALATTMMRALHVQIDAPPHVLADHLALKFLPWQQRVFVTRQPGWSRVSNGYFGMPMVRAMRSQIVVRSRYAEDCLAELRPAGAERYVILGAGLDTFALRQPGPEISVLEIDHPSTQHYKRQRMSRFGVVAPSCLTFLAIDFEKAQLSDLWPVSEEVDFISWLGVTYYLSTEAISQTLSALAKMTANGTQLVLDYWSQQPSSSRPFNRDDSLLWGTRIAVALQGEPMRAFFRPREMEDLARSAGWNVLANLSPSEQNQRYLANRPDRLQVPRFAHLLRLQKGTQTD
jgi:methyltransferase (TIGR00027 family)